MGTMTGGPESEGEREIGRERERDIASERDSVRDGMSE
jgi:hypothetical protein